MKVSNQTGVANSRDVGLYEDSLQQVFLSLRNGAIGNRARLFKINDIVS